jgi:hypothetical protein
MRGLVVIALCLGCGSGSEVPDAGDAAPDAPSDVAAPDAADAGDAADAEILTDFTAPVTLSTDGLQGFSPSVAARDGEALVAWHEFGDAGAYVAYTRVVAGVPGSTQTLSDPYTPKLRPWVAATDAGYVVAYQANDGTEDVVRAVELDATGAVTAGPDTISAAGQSAAMPHVAAAAGEEVFAWTDGTAHSYAMRGGGETVAATPVGTTLAAQGLLNFPRVAIDASGNVFLAYRDGGSSSSDWDVLLVTRPSGGSFGAPVDVSNSPGLLSDDISLAMEDDGTLDLAWVDQNALDVNTFEVMYATRSPQGVVSPSAYYGLQGLWTWTPSVTRGLVCVWNAGSTGTGPFYVASPTSPPAPLLAPETGNMPSLARETGGALDLAWDESTTPRRVRYARRP